MLPTIRQRTQVDHSYEYPDDSYKYPDDSYKDPDYSNKYSWRQLHISFCKSSSRQLYFLFLMLVLR